uniref:Uncharacterized protein n=1 Tax=Musca domestica TaxID=7370 RepID=A0A1I8NAA0_MUSDO
MRVKKSELMIFVLFLVLWPQHGFSKLHLPVVAATDVKINLPIDVGQLLSSILNVRNSGAQCEDELYGQQFGPIALNIGIDTPPAQTYHYTPENYQYVPPPQPAPGWQQHQLPYQMGGYYPYSQPNNQYLPSHGSYYGIPSYYPPAPVQAALPSHNMPEEPVMENPYMRPMYPSGPMVPLVSITELRLPPNRPILPKTPDATPKLRRKLRKGVIITPDSSLYVHIPEEKPSMDIDPRR